MKLLDVNIDLDGVLTGLYHETTTEYHRRLGSKVDWEKDLSDLKAWLPAVIDGKRYVDQIICQPGYFRNLAPLPGAVDGVRAIQERGHRVSIVSSPARHWPISATEKIEWVRHHLPFLHVDAVCLWDQKYRVQCDVMIEDSTSQMKKIREDSKSNPYIVAIDYPHNRSFLADFRAVGYLDTVTAWRQIVNDCIPALESPDCPPPLRVQR